MVFMKKIGEGLSCSIKKEVTGELVYIQEINDVIDLLHLGKNYERKGSRILEIHIYNLYVLELTASE